MRTHLLNGPLNSSSSSEVQIYLSLFLLLQTELMQRRMWRSMQRVTREQGPCCKFLSVLAKSWDKPQQMSSTCVRWQSIMDAEATVIRSLFINTRFWAWLECLNSLAGRLPPNKSTITTTTNNHCFTSPTLAINNVNLLPLRDTICSPSWSLYRHKKKLRKLERLHNTDGNIQCLIRLPVVGSIVFL